jgi:ATP dependent DNA ligase-like protein
MCGSFGSDAPAHQTEHADNRRHSRGCLPLRLRESPGRARVVTPKGPGSSKPTRQRQMTRLWGGSQIIDARQYSPMLESKRVVVPFSDPTWLFEVKWDGWRAIVAVDQGRTRVVSRHGKDLTLRFPELAGVGHDLRTDRAVLDGEICALDGSGRAEFNGIARRRPATFVAFDDRGARSRDDRDAT